MFQRKWRECLLCKSLWSTLAVSFASSIMLTTVAGAADSPPENAARPNILWITSEDNGPDLGCYGDEYATTPHLDALAAKGTIYEHCWSNAPVCAPARTALITGMYPPSFGAEHMRSVVELPDAIRMYPQYLREAGYYCTNNSKEDYNLTGLGKVWDESSRKAHWRNRAEGQPFFAIFNFTTSHESQIRKRPHAAVHDPEQVEIPAYHPDTPEARRDWAQYHDKMTEMDAQAGEVLKQLEEDGLANDTIVFYYGDHGPGMPRSKRWPYNSGLHVPLIVYIPEKFQELAADDYQTGGSTERLVSFVDLAPTLLSLCGVEPPQHMQGHAFLGEFESEPQPYLYGFRGRMDERYDLVRTVRDERYIYIRNYMPHKIYGQYIDYMFQTPTTQVWYDRYQAGKLEPPRTFFWEPKPAEELYDLQSDPDEVNNLADSAAHQDVLNELREAHRQWVFDIRDIGFLPEIEIHARSEAAGVTPYEYGQSDAYSLEALFETADQAARYSPDELPDLVEKLNADDSGVRYWAVMGFLIRGEEAVQSHMAKLLPLLDDDAPAARILAAHTLGLYAREQAVIDRAVDVLLANANVQEQGLYSAMLALNALDELDKRAEESEYAIAQLPKKSDNVPGRLGNYVNRLIEKTLADMK